MVVKCKKKKKKTTYCMHAIQCQAFFTSVLLLTFGACAQELLYSHHICVCVCYQSSASVRRSCDKMNLPDRSSLNLEGSQLGNFVKQFSFPSYSLFLVSYCQTGGHLQLSVLTSVFSESDDHYLKYINQ